MLLALADRRRCCSTAPACARPTDPPQTVGAPVGAMKTAPPADAQPVDPDAGLHIYRTPKRAATALARPSRPAAGSSPRPRPAAVQPPPKPAPSGQRPPPTARSPRRRRPPRPPGLKPPNRLPPPGRRAGRRPARAAARQGRLPRHGRRPAPARAPKAPAGGAARPDRRLLHQGPRRRGLDHAPPASPRARGRQGQARGAGPEERLDLLPHPAHRLRQPRRGHGLLQRHEGGGGKTCFVQVSAAPPHPRLRRTTAVGGRAGLLPRREAVGVHPVHAQRREPGPGADADR